MDLLPDVRAQGEMKMDRLELAIVVLGALIVVNAWLTENAIKRIEKLEEKEK